MASVLSRLGRAAFRRRRPVLARWPAVSAASALGAVTLSGPTEGSFSIPGTESQQAIDLLSDRFPQANGASGRIVFAAPDGEALEGARRAAVTRALAQVARAPGVDAVDDPFDGGDLSSDDRIALAHVTFDAPSDTVEDADREAVQHAAREAQRAGLQVEFGGDAAIDQDD